MYLLIDIGNTRIKWQHRDQKNIISSNLMAERSNYNLSISSVFKNQIFGMDPVAFVSIVAISVGLGFSILVVLSVLICANCNK